MVHNGIEYGLMQAYAEGFDILRTPQAKACPADERFNLDIADIAEVWRRGSVISSWLLDLTAFCARAGPGADVLFRLCRGFRRRPLDHPWLRSKRRSPRMFFPRRSTRASARAQEHTFAEKILSAMRKGFGGHVEPSQTHKAGLP